jgi:hypothetical protein
LGFPIQIRLSVLVGTVESLALISRVIWMKEVDSDVPTVIVRAFPKHTTGILVFNLSNNPHKRDYQDQDRWEKKAWQSEQTRMCNEFWRAGSERSGTSKVKSSLHCGLSSFLMHLLLAC